MAAQDLLRWAASGAMALTGTAGGPPRPEPAALASAAAAAAADVAMMTGRYGVPVEVDGPALLGERAAIAGLTRQGSVSVGGAARFERAADGWIVLNLPRSTDLELLPALVEDAVDPDDWPTLRARLGARSAADLVERGAELGLAIARPGERVQPVAPSAELARGAPRAPFAAGRPLILDLSSLWAGPLAGSLLAASGARVVKIEGRGRLDGARRGPVGFFDLLNAGKESLVLDLGDRSDQGLLRRLVAAADLVIEGSRPRAMVNLGIDPLVAAERHGTSWVSITGHGRVAQPDRIGFGDDAAVAGGLWIDDAGPLFVADAVADPLAGLVAAALGAEQLSADRAAVIDVPLAAVAAWARARPASARVAGSDPDGWFVEVEGERIEVVEPRSRVVDGRAPAADAHGAALRAEFTSR